MTTFTETEICSQALGLIAVGPIADFATDPSNAAVQCRNFFDLCVLELLERFPWSFAMRRALLSTPLLNAPVWGFKNAFQLPNDYLRLADNDKNNFPIASRDVDFVEWRIEGKTLLIDATGINILYISSDGALDTSQWSPLFVTTLTYLLAAKLAIPLTRSMQYASLYNSMVTKSLAEAENAQSVPEGQHYDSETLIVVRR